MSISSPIRISDNGLVFCYDTNSPRSYAGRPTTNYAPSPLDIYAWCSSGATSATLARDATVISPVRGIPMKMTMTGNDPYTNTYNSSTWNLAPAAINQTWTVSVWVKANRTLSSTGEGLFLFEANSSGNYTVLATAGSITFTPTWQRISATKTFDQASTAYVQVRLDGPNTFTSGDVLWWDGLQVEQKSSPTPLVNGSRTNTTGLLDMTENYTLDLSNAGYDASNGIVYSATQNISAGDMGAQFQNFTVDIWFKSNDVVNYRNPIDCNWLQYNGSYSNIGPRLEQNSSGTLGWVLGDLSANYQNITVVSSGLDSTKYHNATLTKDGTALKSYYNGALVTSTTATYTHPGYFKNVQIGRGFSTSSERWFSGYIPTTKIYNRALSSDEIIINYNANKGRFGLL